MTVQPNLCVPGPCKRLSLNILETILGTTPGSDLGLMHMCAHAHTCTHTHSHTNTHIKKEYLGNIIKDEEGTSEVAHWAEQCSVSRRMHTRNPQHPHKSQVCSFIWNSAGEGRKERQLVGVQRPANLAKGASSRLTG